MTTLVWFLGGISAGRLLGLLIIEAWEEWQFRKAQR